MIAGMLRRSRLTDLLRSLHGTLSTSGGYLSIRHAQNDRKHHKVCLEMEQAINQTEKQTNKQ